MSSGDLTTLANVKGYLPGLANTNAMDAVLARLITAASAWIRDYLNRDILEASYTEVLDGSGGPRLFVGQYPVTAVSALAVDGQAVSPSGVVFKGAMLTRTDGGRFGRGLSNVVVTYTAGYAAVPSSIEKDCITLVCWRYRERERLGLVSKSLQTGGEVESYQTKDVPDDVKTSLNNWRKVVPA